MPAINFNYFLFSWIIYQINRIFFTDFFCYRGIISYLWTSLKPSFQNLFFFFILELNYSFFSLLIKNIVNWKLFLKKCCKFLNFIVEIIFFPTSYRFYFYRFTKKHCILEQRANLFNLVHMHTCSNITGRCRHYNLCDIKQFRLIIQIFLRFDIHVRVINIT